MLDLSVGLDPSAAWTFRWIFVADMNGDGLITISDFWLWVKWVFYAPGDCILLGVMLQMPSLAKFFEISTLFLFGWWSFFLSLFVWWLVTAGVLNEISSS
jgi:hypothetical protein